MTEPATCHKDLDSTERWLGNARAQIIPLLAALVRTPVDRELYGQLQSYLDRVGFAACDALEELNRRGPTYQSARLIQLLDAHVSAEHWGAR